MSGVQRWEWVLEAEALVERTMDYLLVAYIEEYQSTPSIIWYENAKRIFQHYFRILPDEERDALHEWVGFDEFRKLTAFHGEDLSDWVSVSRMAVAAMPKIMVPHDLGSRYHTVTGEWLLLDKWGCPLAGHGLTAATMHSKRMQRYGADMIPELRLLVK